MANYRYYADTVEHGTISLGKFNSNNLQGGIDHLGKRGWSVEHEAWFPLDRVVIYKTNASRHDCDARCTHARGKTMNCECSCGGKNHGKRG